MDGRALGARKRPAQVGHYARDALPRLRTPPLRLPAAARPYASGRAGTCPGFFVRRLQKDCLQVAARAKGKLRAFLLLVWKRLLAMNETANARKSAAALRG